MVISESIYDEAVDILIEEGVDEALNYIQKCTHCLPGQARTIINRILSELNEDYEPS